MSEKVRVRFAPSPTGYLHVGGARTALYNWLFARHHGGTFILRIEDTDTDRSTLESAEGILEAMQWLKLDWNEGPYRQADRLSIYQGQVERLLKAGKAYRCTCTPEELEERRKAALAAGRSPRYDGRCRDRTPEPGKRVVIRLRTPDEGVTVVHDLVHGQVTFEDVEMDDFILLRSDGLPTYNFAVVVDDALMAVSHVIRGDDHLSNTPKQIHLYHALDLPLPQFAHIPMILGPDRTRLSKRHGATSVLAYRDLGYLPEALVNYLARLGWSHGDQEIFSQEELCRYFTLEKVGRTPAIFDQAKLDWLNAHYIRQADVKRLGDLLASVWRKEGIAAEEIEAREKAWAASGRVGTFRDAVISLFRERAKTLQELAQHCRFLFGEQVVYDPEAVEKHLRHEAFAHLRELLTELQAIRPFDVGTLERVYRDFITRKGIALKDVAQATRVLLTGRAVSPPLFQVMALLGREVCLKRLETGLAGIR